MTALENLRVAVIGSGPAGFYAAATCSSRRRGRPVRAAADAVGPRAPRRGARPPEDQGRLARVREGRDAAGLPLLRQRRDRPRPLRATTCAATTTRRLERRRADRPPHGHPRRGPQGSLAATAFVAWYNGHPDYCDVADRPRRRAHGGRRQRQRRARLRAHAGADPRGARGHGHGGRRDRRDRRLADPRDRGARPPRAGAGAVHDARSCRSSASWWAPTSRSTRPTWSSTPRARPRWQGDGHGDRRAATSTSCATYAGRERDGQAAARAPALPRLAARAARRRARRGGRRRPEPARAGRRTAASRAVPTGETEVLAVRARAALGRLPRHAARGRPVRRAPRRDPEPRPAAWSTPTAPSARRVLRGLDQARAERRHRHEQEGRDGVDRAPAGGRRGGPPAARREEPQPRPIERARRASAPTRRGVRRLGGDRRARARQRGAAGRPRIKLCAGSSCSIGRARRRARGELAGDLAEALAGAGVEAAAWVPDKRLDPIARAR